MPKFCLTCGEIYDDKLLSLKVDDWNFCPKASCIGRVIEVDELMLPTISELNNKGYYTCNCCSGHYYSNGGDNCYIMFNDGVKLPNLPKGFKWESDYNIIRKRFKGTPLEIFKNTNICANDLLKCAISLPYVEN